MEELGVSLHDLISIDAPKTTVGKALKAIAARRNMTPVVENGQVVLTSTADHRESLRQISFNVSDLTGGRAQAAADLAALVKRLIVPESWLGSGGRGTIEVAPDALRITQTGRVDAQIIVFCEKLRVARGLPTKSHFVLTTRTTRAKAVLGRMTTMNVSPPSPLSSIIEQFKQPAGTEILIDRPSLAAAGVSENTAVKFKADNLPQGEALGKLLGPLGLAWRAVNANTLQVTTQKAIDARMELEFYPVGKRPGVPGAPAGQPPAALIDRIKTELHGARWGEGGGGGTICFDLPSQCLIVLQSQPVQMALEAWLAK